MFDLWAKRFFKGGKKPPGSVIWLKTGWLEKHRVVAGNSLLIRGHIDTVVILGARGNDRAAGAESSSRKRRGITLPIKHNIHCIVGWQHILCCRCCATPSSLISAVRITTLIR